MHPDCGERHQKCLMFISGSTKPDPETDHKQHRKGDYGIDGYSIGKAHTKAKNKFLFQSYCSKI